MSIGKRGPCENPLNSKASSIKTKRPAMPVRMSEGGKKEWKRIVPELWKSGILKSFHRSSLEAMCEQAAICVGLWGIIAKKGYTYKTTTGFIKPRPELALLNQAAGRLLQFQKEFGMTPDALDGMSIPEQPTEDDFDREARA